MISMKCKPPFNIMTAIYFIWMRYSAHYNYDCHVIQTRYNALYYYEYYII